MVNLGPLFFSSGAFWLAIPVLLALVIARLFRTRRREVLAGSLLLWRRLAAQQPKLPPRRVIIDASLLLQFAALLAIIAALSGPTWTVGGTRGREVLLVIDNGPLSRARGAQGTPLLAEITRAAENRLRQLKPEDRVFVARSSPTPKLLTNDPLPPGAAAKVLSGIGPALSGPDAESLWRFCADTAQTLDKSGSLRREVISLRDGLPNLGAQWQCVAPRDVQLNNVAIVGAGSAYIPNATGGYTQILVRLKNFSAQAADGSVALTGLTEANPVDANRSHSLHLDGYGDGSVVFTVDGQPKEAVRIGWKAANGKSDALPEDDVIIASPRATHAPRIRFAAGNVPVLEKLFREINPPAVIVAPTDTSDVDLEIRIGNVPEAMPSNAQALMLISPDAGFRSYFEVPGGILKNPQAQKGDDDAFTRFLQPSADSLFAVPRAREIQVTGDMAVLVSDRVSNRPLVARFSDERRRPIFLLAFVPGQGLPPERALDAVLAALLVQMADFAAGSGEPFSVATAQALEEARNEPLPLNWTADAAENAKLGAGVLDEHTSNLGIGKASNAEEVQAADWQSTPRTNAYDLTPWFIVLALLLVVYEQWRERPRTTVVKTNA